MSNADEPLTTEQIERARQILDRARAVTPTRVASKSFVDRMTSASADPRAATAETPERPEPDDPSTIIPA